MRRNYTVKKNKKIKIKKKRGKRLGRNLIGFLKR